MIYVPIVGNNQKKLFHLFLLCPKVRTFWNELKVWFYTYANIEISLENKNILFSYTGKKEQEKYIYVLAKCYIYQNKFIFRNISIQSFVSLLKKKDVE